MPTVLVAWTRLIVNHAASSGLDPTPILKRIGLDMSSLEDRDARIDARIDAEVWNQIAAALGDPDLGVHLSERSVSASSLGVLGYLARTSSTLGEALQLGQRYQRLIKDSSCFELQWAPRTVTVIEPAGDREVRPRAFVEAKICNYITLARAWADRTTNRAVEVRFQHAKPDDTSELERFFDCPIYFDQRDTALVLNRDALEVPLRTADPELAQYLETWASARLAALGPKTFIDEVRAAVHAELAAQDISIQRVARRLAVSTRSLQRQLSSNGKSFRDVVDAIRHERAVELLSTGVTFDDIAEQLGFSDARAFRRAFRRWTGTPPSHARHVITA